MTLQVHVWADYLCPWAYLGQLRARRLAEVHGAEVTHRPFELHPDIKPGGHSIRAVYGQGDDAAAEQKTEFFVRLAESEGAPLRFPDRVLPTRRAHIAACAVATSSPESFQAMHDSLFAAVWEHVLDIESVDVLCELADHAGADSAAVRRAVESGVGSAVEQSIADARSEGITGTPGFLFNPDAPTPFAVVGLQPVEFFDRVATRLGH